MAKRGAPKGNQNARKHSFYSRALDEAEKLQMEEAFDWDELERGIDNLALKYDANLEEADLAQKRAEALLRKSAMESVGGQIIVPLNCGQEIYDVITISDGRCGISNRKYRVLGIESRYDCLQNIYQQKLMLGAL